jgi:hypothetical protein
MADDEAILTFSTAQVSPDLPKKGYLGVYSTTCYVTLLLVFLGFTLFFVHHRTTGLGLIGV